VTDASAVFNPSRLTLFAISPACSSYFTIRRFDGAATVVDVVAFWRTLSCTPATLITAERDAPLMFAA
jgi:hypothetical protein